MHSYFPFEMQCSYENDSELKKKKCANYTNVYNLIKVFVNCFIYRHQVLLIWIKFTVSV